MLDHEALTVQCANGHEVKVSIGQARRSPTIVCPQCHGAVKLDASQMDRELRGVDRELANLERTLKRLGR